MARTDESRRIEEIPRKELNEYISEFSVHSVEQCFTEDSST